uniref:Endonuclease/exonuclease/phosphatase domain-containing protein n=1 Tax=Anopheles arabiensis TaxID=7173 RepID=A0A182IHZ3_ANOAR
MFRETVEKVQPLLVLISETHVTEEEAFEQYYIKGYRVVSCLSHSRHTGGVAAYARSDIVLKVILNESLEGNWFLGLAISRGMTAGNYSILYHSPSASDSRFVDILEEWLERFLDFSKMNIIVGDFNIDWLNVEKSAKLKSLMDS